MASSNVLPLFDEEYHPQIKKTLSTAVDHVQEKMSQARSSNVEEAERIFDKACDDCVKTFEKKLNEIKTSVKSAKPDPKSATYDEDNRKYHAYIDAAAIGVEQSKRLFDTVVKRIRDIVSTVLECIKAGVKWICSQFSDAFDSIKSLLNS